MIDTRKFTGDCLAVRKESPLVLNITNYVAMNFSANALLAIGASPIMSVCREEIEELVHLCSSLVINIGCPDPVQVEIMKLAARIASSAGKPWVLDPVGAGASRFRTMTGLSLGESGPSVIRGNASEIMALAGMDIRSKGVDSSCCSDMAVEAAKAMAERYGTIVSVSGPVDYITDGSRVETVSNGDMIMPRVTAMGCTASAITAAFLAVDVDVLAASVNAMLMMGLAGEAAASHSRGTGTFAAAFIDELSNFNPGTAIKEIRQ